MICDQEPGSVDTSNVNTLVLRFLTGVCSSPATIAVHELILVQVVSAEFRLLCEGARSTRIFPIRVLPS